MVGGFREPPEKLKTMNSKRGKLKFIRYAEPGQSFVVVLQHFIRYAESSP